GLAPGLPEHRAVDSQGERSDDRARDLVLYGEDALERELVVLGPELAAGRGLHQLGADPDRRPRPAQRSAQQVAGAEPIPDLARGEREAAERERGVAGDHVE